MSFGFQFDDSEMDDEYVSLGGGGSVGVSAPSSAVTATASAKAPFRSHSLEDLISRLPSRISYSCIDVDLTRSADNADASQGPPRRCRILRRDLFDARFQMLLDDDEDDEDEDEDMDVDVNAARRDQSQSSRAQIDQDSDLVPGIYEGGLKTWECALDLIDTLDSLLPPPPPPPSSSSLLSSGQADASAYNRHQNVLELGCGTALPTLYLLEPQWLGTHLHLSDYNADVLSLVTLPNLILAWYNSPASEAFRRDQGLQLARAEAQELDRRGQSHFDTSLSTLPTQLQEGELSLTPELITAFVSSLERYAVRLGFYSGSWSHFPPALTPGRPLDLILTSETIYSLHSLPSLVSLLRQYSSFHPSITTTTATTVLVAAKVIYFGVGGGVESFKHAIAPATTTPLKQVTRGVGRTVLRVDF
ncbi:hypothetical protein BCV70DRAFT_162105 [Testicularia cyperi]|uniref:protein-histidine N-methyltransferase n=1 Tax=Testicularia cyperi TaxID=1882483 RepID=A0A317XMN5_9BASI|nr:hypothetical protein BCV70DRAFT_162105 [Testicularia cyperi]